MALEDRYYPPNIGNPSAFYIDGYLFMDIRNVISYLVIDVGMTVKEANDYIDMLKDDTIKLIEKG